MMPRKATAGQKKLCFHVLRNEGVEFFARVAIFFIPVSHLSLSQTPSSWRLIANQAMLLLDVRFVQTDLWNGDRSAAVASCA